jgi:hypothetical protein
MSKFIPVRYPNLVERLADDFFSGEDARRRFRDFARLVSELERHYAGGQLRVHEDLYAAYDPDEDTLPPSTVSPEEDQDRTTRLFDWLDRAFGRANFEIVSSERFATALQRASNRAKAIRLDPDLDSIERFRIYQRGTGAKAMTLRPAKKFFRRVEITSATFSRVAIVLKTKGDPCIYLKLYKDVVQEDVDLILPTVRLKMRFADKLKLGGSGGAAAISFAKMVKTVATLAPKIAIMPMKVLLLPALVLLGTVYGGKTFLDYTKIRASYLTALVEHLYSLHIATNHSVLTHVAELSAEEEAKEILVAYAFLHAAGEAGRGPEGLGQDAGAWIKRVYGIDVAFDVPDALAKIEERGLGRLMADKSTRVVLPLDDAIATLDRTWDDLYQSREKVTT